MLPILNIGPLAVQMPGLILLLGIWIATLLIERNANRHDSEASRLNSIVFLGLIVGLAAARLLYAIRFSNVYLEDPLGLLSLNPSTLAPVEGALVGILAAGIYAARTKMELWNTLDALTIGFAVFALALGVAHLASGDAFGIPTEVPWAIDLWGASRHPTQIYEILSAGVTLVLIGSLRDRKPFSGFIFLLWIALFALSRMVVEAFRGDSLLVFGSLRQAQLISLMLIVGSMILLYALAHRKVSAQ